MKPLLALLLCLALCLPVFALAETAAQTQTIDLTDFTMEIGTDAMYEVFSERQEGMPAAIIYPSYDPTRLDAPNISIIWSAGNMIALLQEELGMGMDAYADMMLSYLAGSFTQYGGQVVRQEVTACDFTENDGYFSLLVITQDAEPDAQPEEYHITFHYRWFDGSGSYIFYLIAPSSEDMALLEACIDTIQPK